MDEVMRKLRRTGIYSDLVIKCGQLEFNVHRAIVCTRSEYFASACKPDAFKEGAEGFIELKATREDSEDDANVDADDPEAVKLMIDFLYTVDYDAASAIMHAKMYAIGSKYGVEDLQKTAAKKYEEVMKDEWDSADFARAIRIVYITTPDEDRGLRNITAQTIYKHKDVLLAKEEIEAAVSGIDKLAYALLRDLRTTKGPMCGICGVARAVQCLGERTLYGDYNRCDLMIVACDCEGFRQCEYCRSSG